MTKRNVIMTACTAAILTVAAVSSWGFGGNGPERGDHGNSGFRGADSKPPGEHPPTFYVEDLFYDGLSARFGSPLEPQATGDKRTAKGVIVPHHYVASGFITEGFELLAARRPSTVVVIGPNHNEVGESVIQTSDYAWATPFGTVLPDVEALAAFKAGGLVRADEVTAAQEHSVGGMMPYVAKFLPGAKVVPLMLKRFPSEQEADDLVARLTALARRDDVAVVASVDFSHYLTAMQADARDEETLRTMRERDYETMLTFTNDNIDSPISIAVFLRAMDALGIGNYRLLRHDNSARLLNDPIASTTSYVTAVYAEDARR